MGLIIDDVFKDGGNTVTQLVVVLHRLAIITPVTIFFLLMEPHMELLYKHLERVDRSLGTYYPGTNNTALYV